VLIYFTDELQHQVVRKFHDALAPGGFLFLGRSEAILKHGSRFAPVTARLRIFRRGTGDQTDSKEPEPSAHTQALGLALLDSTSVVALLVDEDGLILLANRRARQILGTPSVGARVGDVLDASAARSLVAAVSQALRGGSRARLRDLSIHGAPFDVTVEPSTHGSARAAVVIAHEAGGGPLAPAPSAM